VREALLLGGLALRRGSADQAARWIVATIAERLELPPPGVVVDLGAALLDRASLEGQPIRTDDPVLASALRRYEDAFLRRIAADPRVIAAGDAASRYDAPMRARAVAMFVSAALARVGFDEGLAIDPGTVRRLLEPAEDACARGEAVLREDPALRERLAKSYLALARGAQRTRELFGETDRFVIENLAVLGSLAQRRAIADVLAAQECLARRVPRVRARRRPAGEVAASPLDESVYPAGGFASLSTSGSLENVVTSELMYMEEHGVDLFDLRYAEGELLYYTRDEALLVRPRRHVVIALGAELVRARVKDADVPWQRIVLVLAVVVLLVNRLVESLGREALTIELSVDPSLEAERQLLALVLREPIARGIVEVGAAATTDIDVAFGEDVGAATLSGWSDRAKAALTRVLERR
jgi:hypothetical protein